MLSNIDLAHFHEPMDMLALRWHKICVKNGPLNSRHMPTDMRKHSGLQS
jgi:hypothetical protein